MYLSLKTILLGAAVASAIPFSPNGTHNVTGPKAHGGIFGLPWLNPGRNDTAPKNVTEFLEVFRDLFKNGRNVTVTNGTHNVTGPKAHPTIFGLPWINPGRNDTRPKNFTEFLETFRDLFKNGRNVTVIESGPWNNWTDIITNVTITNVTKHHLPKLPHLPKPPHHIKPKDGNEVGHPVPPPKTFDEVLLALLDLIKNGPNGNGTVIVLGPNGRVIINAPEHHVPKLPPYIKRRDANEVGHPSPPAKTNHTDCLAPWRDLLKRIGRGHIGIWHPLNHKEDWGIIIDGPPKPDPPTAADFRRVWNQIFECQHGINDTYGILPSAHVTGIWQGTQLDEWLVPSRVQHWDSARAAAPDALHLHARGDAFCKLKCLIKGDLNCAECP